MRVRHQRRYQQRYVSHTRQWPLQCSQSSELISDRILLSPAIISPILAAGAVAIGVPFLLAYVYGIVPITLCRSKAQVNGSSEQPMRNSLNEEEAQAFLKQLSEKGTMMQHVKHSCDFE